MKRDNERQSAIILSVIGIIPVIWLALLIAPSVKGGLPEILPKVLTAFNDPFHIKVCEDSLKTVLVLLLSYGLCIGIYFSTQRNYRKREEHGSAKWGNARAVNKKYRQSPASANKLMTQNVCIGLDAKKHRRNLNTLVCGGSGAGKTRFYCKPNLMQWKDVLAVYSVKVNTDPDNPMEVATVDETKKQLLSDIFWEMNEISSRTESKTHTEIEESDDGHGNIVETETTVTETFLYITVSHKTVDEMASMYGFNQEQKDYLAELLKDENNQLWSQVLYGIGYSDGQIVTVALSQVGNVGGQPYWSWYGFDSRVEWCACFVSWCANECGYIDSGIIPKYAGCVNGAQWFKDRGQWADRNYEPAPGTIIFFDWEGDGVTDHTGIVQKCENGTVYTVEGNSGDTCRTKTYPVGSSVIYGYGIPAY